MEDSMALRYWCHVCSRIVNPIMEVEVKCPFCMTGFVEAMSNSPRYIQDPDTDFGSDRALSLWASIFLGMMGNSRRRRRSRRMDFEDGNGDNDDGEAHHGGEAELDRELEPFIRRRRSSSATILQLLQGIQAGMLSESENSEGDRYRDNNRDGEQEHAILTNLFNQTILVQGSYDSSDDRNQNQGPIDSLGDYFTGPGLDLLLQHLAENDPNRYGTPPACKEAIEALPSVTVKELLQCSVCLDDFEIGTDAKEMPCKHKFHSGCISPWLELHSSCPVCRYQLPIDESKLDHERSRDTNNQGATNNEISESNSNHRRSIVEEGDAEGRNGNGRRFSFPWLFNSLFSASSSSQTSESNTSSTSPSSSTNAPGSAYDWL